METTLYTVLCMAVAWARWPVNSVPCAAPSLTACIVRPLAYKVWLTASSWYSTGLVVTSSVAPTARR